MAATVGMVPPLLPLIAGGFALSPASAGLVNTAYSVGRLAGGYPGAYSRARWGTRAGAVLGIGTLALGGIACGLAPGFGSFLAARLVMGFGASIVFVAVFAELLEVAPIRWRGRIANAFEGVAIGGVAVGGVVAAGLAPAIGWRGVFTAAGVAVLPGLGVWWWIPGTAGRHETRVAAGPDARAGTPAVRSIMPVYAASFTLAFTWAGLFVTLAPLLGHARHGLDAGALGLAFAVSYGAELVGLGVMGLVVDRHRPEPLFLAGAVAVAAGTLLLGLAAWPAVFVLGLVLVGTGFSVWMVPAIVLAGRTGTPIPARHLAAYRIALDAGTILGPTLVGVGAELVGDRAAAGATGLVTLAGALALLRRPGTGHG
jgi:MFS family permease